MQADVIFDKEKSPTPTDPKMPPGTWQKEASAPVQDPLPPANAPPPESRFTSRPLPPPPQKSIKGLLIKILLGVLALTLFGFVIIRFILPIFTGGVSQKVELTYWGLWENENTLSGVIKDFESKNPNIRIKYIKQDIKQYNDTLQTRVNNGTGPDIYRFHNTWLPMLKEELLPLPNSVISPNDFRKKYYPVVQRDLVRNGAIYGIPFEIDTLAMFVNTDILNQAGVTVPTDWNDFVKSAIKLTVKDTQGRIKTSGASLGTYDNIRNAPDILGMLLVQNGANTTEMSKTSANAAEAIEFYTSFAKGGGAMWNDSLEEASLSFARGNVAFYFGYSWEVFQIQAINPELKFAIHKVPGLPGRRSSVASYWAEGISTKSKHPKEAMEFLKFLTIEQSVEKIYEATSKTRSFGEPYPFVTHASRLKDNKIVYPFVEQAPSATSTYFVSNTYDNGINDKMNAYLGNAVRSVLGNTSPQSAVETLSLGITQILAVYEPKKPTTR